jgi:HK97 gp10 family phage protein
MIDIDVRGREEIKQFMDAFGTDAIKVIDDELRIVANNLRNDIIKSMRSSPANGRHYGSYQVYNKKAGSNIRRKRTVPHIASSPGNPPRIMSGNLINRIFVDHGEGYSRLYTENILYAKFLEYGTKKMEPRPFLGPAIDRSKWEDRIIHRIIAERFAGRRLEE